MRTEVETRRLRTWDRDVAGIPQQAWRIILKFGYIRMSRTWYLLALGIIIAVIEILLIAGTARGVMVPGQAPDPGTVIGMVTGFIGLGVLALVLVGAPLFADDMRFNAPLFYFSRPLRPDDYLRGKGLQLATLVGAVTTLPTIILVLLGLVLSSVAGTPTDYAGNELTGSKLANYEAQHITGFAGWLFTGAVMVAGVTVVMGFLASVTLCASAYTRRGWHAGMAALAVVGGWGLLGASATLGTKGAYSLLFGPFGWMALVLERPMTMHFRAPTGTTPSYLAGSEVAIPIAYVLLIATSIVALGATVRRLRHVEAIL